MKFYNTTTPISLINTNYVVLDNSSGTQAAIIITIQLINNSTTQVSVVFKRQYLNKDTNKWQYNSYASTINVKTGTTIIDHIVVVNAGQKYVVSSNSNDLVISCSYGI